MYEIDAALTHAINGLAGQSSTLDLLMIWFSNVGVYLMVLAVVTQWWRGPERAHIRHIVVAAGFSFLLGLGLNQLILLVVHRVRPYDGGVTNLLIERSADFSFPSDHATAAFAIAAAFLLHASRRAGFAFQVAACLIAFSRIYIGTHYASDVLGGALTGVVAALMVRATYKEGTKPDRLITSIL